jgi:hypothetical protein
VEEVKLSHLLPFFANFVNLVDFIDFLAFLQSCCGFCSCKRPRNKILLNSNPGKDKSALFLVINQSINIYSLLSLLYYYYYHHTLTLIPHLICLKMPSLKKYPTYPTTNVGNNNENNHETKKKKKHTHTHKPTLHFHPHILNISIQS